MRAPLETGWRGRIGEAGVERRLNGAAAAAVVASTLLMVTIGGGGGVEGNAEGQRVLLSRPAAIALSTVPAVPKLWCGVPRKLTILMVA